MLADAFKKGAESVGAQVKKFNFRGKKISPCLDCGYCHSKTEFIGCSQKDDMSEVYEGVLWADMVVFAAPLYFASIAAQMKIIIDRFYALDDPNGYPKKEAIFLMTAASPEKESFMQGVHFYQAFLEHGVNWIDKGHFLMGRTYTDITKSDVLDKAFEYAKTAVVAEGKTECFELV